MRYIHELLNERDENPSDGIITINDAEWGKHLLNFDADHFELIGMRQNYNPKVLFEFYSNTIKSNDEAFLKSLNI